MRKWLDKITALVLCSTLVLAACGDDDKAAPVEPEPPAAELPPKIVGSYGTLVSSFRSIFSAVEAGETEVAGEGGGSVTITGNEWTFQDYSPDGSIIKNGTLDVRVAEMPMLMTGTIVLSGSYDAELVFDIAISVAGTEVLLSGTIAIDGTEFDIAAFLAVAAAATEAG